MTQLMTMRDIAGLARVQRPVVTVWRRRARATPHPFPTSHLRRDGQELFLREEVVAWLEETHRGNNPDVRVEAAAHSLLAPTGRREAEALSALLTLRHLTGTALAEAAATADDLLDLADAQDPDDRCLMSELVTATDLLGLAQAADELVDAAWNEPSAHRRLVEARLREPNSALAQVALTAEARRLLLAVLGPLARDLGEATLMDPTGCAVDTLAELAAAIEAPVLVLDGTTPAHRLTRRQLLLADVSHRSVERGSGDWSVTGPVAHLVVLPTADHPAAGPAAHLDLLDEIALQLDDRQVVLCLAPAATLTDPLDGESLARRDQLLRDGYVKAIVRLPAGLRPAQAREPAALWLLAAADPTPPAERRTLVADLSGVPLAQAAAGLPDDLLAAWQGTAGARRRAWAHLYPVPTRDLISASGSLVPPRPPRPTARPRSGADWAVDLRRADPAGLLADYRFDVIDHPAEPVTIAQAIERGWVRVLPGRRLDLEGLPSGRVPVLGHPPDHPRTVDRLALLARTDAELTEPGDVVFTVHPATRAVLDAEGGSLVLSPARILRLHADAPLLAAAVVARINAATGSAWRSWTVATLPEPDRANLGAALTDLARERARLVAELGALDALTLDLTTAVESRRLSLTKETHGSTSG